MSYRPPVEDILFQLEHVAGLSTLPALPGLEDFSPDLAQPVLEEAGKLAAEVWAPLNQVGDREGATVENGVVRTASGFPDAYRQLAEGGWLSLPFEETHGGQNLPWTLAVATHELWHSANMSLGLAPLLSTGAMELIQHHGSEEQKATFLPKMLAGDWTGTMNLTESHAGSDLGLLRTRAEPAGDHYLIKGQKVFITWGEHDCAENIVHLVLARLPEAPEGHRGISLFIVPKFLPDGQGGVGRRNDLRCVSVEHKLGIHGSPTAVMAYGDNEGAVGYLIGEENRGLACMFTMMNNARLMVGLQGVAIAERASQQAAAYAGERRQGRGPDGNDAAAVPILRHGDIRRTLAAMRSLTQGARALTLYGAGELDRAAREPDQALRRDHQARLDFLIPIIKAWSTNAACRVADLGVQVHGGMGFIEETGAAQHYRDARILPIYEGTNGIQAMDLVSRKLLRDSGAAAKKLFSEVRTTAGRLSDESAPDLQVIGNTLLPALNALELATQSLLESEEKSLIAAGAAADAYCQGLGTLLAGWLLGKGALAATIMLEDREGDPELLNGKIRLARFYAASELPQAGALAMAAVQSPAAVQALQDADLGV